MVRVYHSNKSDFTSALFALHPTICPRVKIVDWWKSDRYNLVAQVKTNNLEEAYILTQSIEEPWWMVNLQKVQKKVSTPTRSTSVGDMMVMDGSVYLIKSVGLEIMPELAEPERRNQKGGE
jgi:hypothetical protein